MARAWKPATCSVCGETWPRDPVLEVPCPDCKVKVGTRCRRPSGHGASSPHIARDQAALDAGVIQRCRGQSVRSAVVCDAPRSISRPPPPRPTANERAHAAGQLDFLRPHFRYVVMDRRWPDQLQVFVEDLAQHRGTCIGTVAFDDEEGDWMACPPRDDAFTGGHATQDDAAEWLVARLGGSPIRGGA